jgi:hypothetical protein
MQNTNISSNFSMKIIFRFLIFILVCCGATSVYAKEMASDFQYKKDVFLPSVIQGSEYIRVALDQETAAHSRNYADVRVFSGAREVPYQLLTETGSDTTNYYPAQVINQGKSKWGTFSFIVDLGVTGALHNQINIISDEINYRRPVEIYYSNYPMPIDSLQWIKIPTDGYIYNYTDEVTKDSFSRGDVNYSDNTGRYLKVAVLPGEGTIELVKKVEVYRKNKTEVNDAVTTVTTDVTENPEFKSTEVVIDLGSGGIPTHSVTLSIPNLNFSRRAVVQTSPDNKKWTFLSEDYLFNVTKSKWTGSNATINYNEVSSRYLRVIIFNEDNESLNIGSIATVKSIVRSIVFEAAKDVSYSLYYGNGKITAPQYDISKIWKYLDTESLPEGQLSSELKNESFTPAAAPLLPYTERNRGILNVMIVILVLCISFIAFTYLRKINVNKLSSDNKKNQKKYF